MFNAIVSWSLKHRWFVVLVAVVVAIAGVISFAHLPVDAFPDTTPVQVQINTVAPALGPEEIEQQITFPIEQALSGLKGLSEIRSLSKFGLSQVVVIFEDGIGIYFARQLVGERLGTVELPIGIETPKMGPVATGLGEVFHYVVTSQSHSLRELRTIQDWIIKPQLHQVEGVAEVNSWGGEELQYQVVVEPTKLLKYRLTLEDVFEALRRNNLTVGGGVMTRAGESMLVHGIALTTTLDQVAQTVVRAVDGVPIFVGDLGEVIEGNEIRRGAVTYQGEGEAVLGLGFMLMGENSREVTRKLATRLEEVRKSIPEGVNVIPVYERSRLVDHVLRTVRTNLLEGALLVIVILFLFLGNFRAGLIVASAIPLAMLATSSVMLQAGIAATLMSLGAIDFGLLVDSAVIQVENSVRRLSAATPDRPRFDVLREAIVEVRKPTMFGELIIMIVYLPILTLQDIEGKLFAPMALTVVIALAASLVLSVTVIPALTCIGLTKHGHRHEEPRLVRLLLRYYDPMLRKVLRFRALVIALLLVMLGGGALLASRLGAVFIPRLSEEAIVINTVRLAGVSLEESVRYGSAIEQLILREFPDEIEHIWTRTGTAEVATDPMGFEVSDVFMTLKPRSEWKRGRTQEQLVEQMDLVLSGMPGMRCIFAQPIELRVNEMIAGVRSDLGVKVFGDDFHELKSLGSRIDDILRTIPGSADTTVEQITGQPVLEIRLRPDQLARYAVPAADVLNYVAAVGNIHISDIRKDQMRFPLTLRLPDSYRSDPHRLSELLMYTTGGQVLPLSRLADIRIVEGPSTINREWGKRRIVIQSNVRGRDISSFVHEARERIEAEIKLPTGYFVRYGGQFEHLERGRARLMIVVPIALGLVFTLLYLTYRRIADCIRIFLTLPLAAVGGLAALYFRDMPFSISAGIGFVAMSGVSVLGDMVFVSHFRALLERGVELRAAVVEAARTRLRPVLMTGLVASVGFLPMALNTGVGAEVQRPLATVVIGCVMTSIPLTLLVLPVLCSLIKSPGPQPETI